MKQFIERLKLAFAILTDKDGGFVAHTKRELGFVGYFDGDKMNEAMAQSLIDLLRVMGTQGHSGFSAAHMRALFAKAAAYEPLGPLSGADNEWMEVSEGTLQNKRCGHVFKKNGVAYDIDGVVFEEPDGARFTGRYSRVPIEFPYTPVSVVASVREDACDETKKHAAQKALNLHHGIEKQWQFA